MEYRIRFCTLEIVFRSEAELLIEDAIAAFEASKASYAAESQLEVPIILTGQLPEAKGTCCYADSFLRYYKSAEGFSVYTHPDANGMTVMCTHWLPDYSAIRIRMNAQVCTCAVSLHELMLYFPLPAVLSHFHAVQLHASRVAIGDAAVLFCAPSETGKSTQARLWKQYAGARILNNDRTLVQKTKRGFLTGGCLQDGSEPIRRNDLLRPAAVVLLEQGTENTIRQSGTLPKMHRLMSQTSAWPWDAAQLTQNRILWADVLNAMPVYDYACRPDEESVRVLYRQMRKDGIL